MRSRIWLKPIKYVRGAERIKIRLSRFCEAHHSYLTPETQPVSKTLLDAPRLELRPDGYPPLTGTHHKSEPLIDQGIG